MEIKHLESIHNTRCTFQLCTIISASKTVRGVDYTTYWKCCWKITNSKI